MPTATPRPAATIVVVRSGPDGPEVLLVRRSDSVAFMAGAHVFPGGRVDEADGVSLEDAYPDGVPPGTRFEDLAPEAEVAYRVAALRELLEEAGLLVAFDVAGAPVTAKVADRFRTALAGMSLSALAARDGVRLGLDTVVPFAHWVTPESEPRRYDTRFFMVAAPEGQAARHDEGETTALAWMRPVDAVAACRAGTLRLAPPTWTTLRGLEEHASLGALVAWARGRRIVRIQPDLRRDDSGTVLTLPGDPLMPAPADTDVPEETRFELEEGRGWVPCPSSIASTR